MKKLQEGAHFHSSSDMNADMSTEAADMVVLAVDKYIPTQNWEVSYQSSKIELCRAAMLPLLNAYCCIECTKKKSCPSKRMSGFFFEEHAQPHGKYRFCLDHPSMISPQVSPDRCSHSTTETIYKHVFCFFSNPCLFLSLALCLFLLLTGGM